MFCQNCGAELRLEEGFCAICGAGVPKPVLRHEPADRASTLPRTTPQPTQPPQPTSGSGSSLFSSPPSNHPAPQPDPRQVHTFQAIRQASGQRGSIRSLPPVASLAVPAAPPEPTTPPAPPAAVAPEPEALPLQEIIVPALPTQTNGHAPIPQPSLNGYHPLEQAAPVIPANSYTPRQAIRADADQTSVAASIRLPGDLPNRLALTGLAGMFLSFFLPWVIISGSRAAPLSIGWPIVVPLALILGVASIILMPERALITRFFLALPFAFGSFGLGSALVIFVVSSAIAANTVGVAFLGVDIGFILFAIASCLLVSAGYFKLLRELPLLYGGIITLAPLPGQLGRAAASSAPRQPAPTSANQPTTGS